MRKQCLHNYNCKCLHFTYTITTARNFCAHAIFAHTHFLRTRNFCAHAFFAHTQFLCTRARGCRSKHLKILVIIFVLVNKQPNFSWLLMTSVDILPPDTLFNVLPCAADMLIYIQNKDRYV
jgi:hypothetical protein